MTNLDPEVSSTAAAESTVGAVDDIAAQVSDSASEPNDAAMRAAQLSAAPAVRSVSSESPTDPRDSKGNVFDAAVHHANPDGTPKLYGGRLRRKRASKVETASVVGTQNGQSPTAPTQAPKPELTATEKAAARASGAQLADFLIMATQAVGGEEFTPIINGKFETADASGMPEYNERKLLRDAMSDIAEHYRMMSFSPAWGAVLTFGLYIGLRFRMPQTQSRWQKAKAWAYGKIGSIMGKRRATRTDSRNDDERKEHASVGTRASGAEVRS